MADLFCCKLLGSPSLDFSRLRSFCPPHPLNASPSFSLTVRKTRALPPPRSSDSTPLDSRFGLVSSSECSDGSIVFRFGDVVESVESVDREDTSDDELILKDSTSLDESHQVSLINQVVEEERRTSASVSDRVHRCESDEVMIGSNRQLVDAELESRESAEKRISELAVLNAEANEISTDSCVGPAMVDHFVGEDTKEENDETIDSLEDHLSRGSVKEEFKEVMHMENKENLNDFDKPHDGERSGIKANMEYLDGCVSVDVIIKEDNAGILRGGEDDLDDFHEVGDGNLNNIVATADPMDDYLSGDQLQEVDNLTTGMKSDMEDITAVEDVHDYGVVDDSEQSGVMMTTSSELGVVMDDEETIHSADIEEMNGGETMNSVSSSELELVNEVHDGKEMQGTGERSLKTEPSVLSVTIEDKEVHDNVSKPLSAYAALEAEQVADTEEITVERTPSSVVVGYDAHSGILHGGTGVDVEESDAPEGSGQLSDSVEIVSANTTFPRVEVSTPIYFLSSGAASLPHPSKALTGLEDAHFVACQNWFGVAGGVGLWSLGGNLEGRYAQEIIQNCEKAVRCEDGDELSDVKKVLKHSAAVAKAPGSATVLIAYLNHEVLNVVNIGDTGFLLVRNGFVYQKSSPMVHELNFPLQIGRDDDPLEVLQEYHIVVEDGDVIIAATDGLFDNLYEQEISSIVSKLVAAGKKPMEIAESLARKAQEVGMSTATRSPFADAVQAAGYAGYSGGKIDAVTVVVSFVVKGSTP